MSLYNWTADQKLVEKISRSMIAGNIFHAYIIEGDTCIDKTAFAKDFLKAIICKEAPGVGCDQCVDCRKIQHDNYEDLYFVESDGLSVKDDAVFHLQERLKLRPAGGNRNLAIVKDADTMTSRAQNRFLKTLEEPTPGTVILLLSENKENLLETIRSRCIAYRLNSLDRNEMGNELESAESVIEGLLEDYHFFRMKEILNKYIKNREDAFQLLDGMERIYRDFLIGKDLRGRLMKKEDLFRHIEYIEQARRDLVMKVNYNYAIKNLIINIGG